MSQVILIEYAPRPGKWQPLGEPISPQDRRGSGTVIWKGKIVTVAFGWDDGVPGVWLDDGAVPIGGGKRGHYTPVARLQRLADLREGPFELDGPRAPWRWSLSAS